jgi:predicted PurR-regulated permease PerM
VNRVQHLRFWFLGLLALVIVLWALSDVLMPFVAALAIAFVLDPLADRLEALRVRRWAAAIIVLGGFALVILVALLLVLPLIIEQVQSFIAELPRYEARLRELVGPFWEAVEQRVRDQADLRGAVEQHAGRILGWGTQVAGSLWRGGLALIDIVSLMVITPVVAFYLLRDWDRMVAHVDAHLPLPFAQDIRSIAGDIDRTLVSFVRGQGTVCLILGGFYAVALTVAGLNFGILVGLVSGVLSFIPFVGTIVGFLSSTLIAFVQFDSWTMRLVIAGIFIFGQVVEGNVLTPKLVGESVGLHPVWVMFALLAGGSLAGFTGILLAVPVAAAIGVIVRFFLSRYRESRYYHGTIVLPDKDDGEDGP